MQTKPEKSNLTDCTSPLVDGNETAEAIFERHYRQYRPLATWKARQILGDSDAVTEATSIAWYRIWNNIRTGRYDEQGSFPTFLCNGVAYAAKEIAKKQSRDIIRLKSIAAKNYQESTVTSSDRFDELLDGLDEQEKTVLTNRYKNQFSFPEIAQLTGLTLHAVDVVHNRALRKVRRQFESG